MEKNLTGKKPTFKSNGSGANTYRLLILLILVLGSFFLLRALSDKQIRSPFDPTPVPTRTANSFVTEAEARFNAGDLNGSIAAYKQATQLEPQNVQIWSKMAQIQVYSSNLLTTDDERRTRLQEALSSINQAVKVAPDDSTAHAIRAFVLDWNSNSALAGDQSDTLLAQAEQEAVQALQLDNQNTLALAYYAEILLDQQKWMQADQYIQQAIERDPSLMDVHRVNAIVLESFRDYNGAIQEYEKAAEITPNLTFLYISIGTNYRFLKQYDRALEYFDKAARIDDQLQIKDPIPYVAIGKTYTQTGDFLVASLNMRKALTYNPYSPDLYGQLGIVYFHARNYETAILALKCAVRGCTAQESCDLRQCDPATDPQVTVQGLPLSDNTVVYYYTYGSVLTGMHTPTSDKCTEAVQVLAEVRAKYADDADIMSIVQANEQVCASFGITYNGAAGKSK
ncbi:MAG: tetratricopeptide repeat protein [Anaerolineaceae bacterium]|jgi:tetratricopeptide (TPR) repeat protein